MNQPNVLKAFNDNLPQQPQSLLVPTVVDILSNNGRAWDIESYMMNKAGFIHFTGHVDDLSSDKLKQQLRFLDYNPEIEEITIWIDSPGGSVFSGDSAIDAIIYMKKDVRTIVAGLAASMGSMLLINGAPGKRFAYPNSQVMIHQPSAGGRMNQQQSSENHRQLTNMRERGDACYAYSMGLDPNNEEVAKLVHELMDFDTWLNATEAEQLGLIDAILPMDPEVAKKADRIQRQTLHLAINQKELDDIGKAKYDERRAIKAVIDYRKQVITEAAKNPGAITNPYLKYAVNLYKGAQPEPIAIPERAAPSV